MPLSPKFFNEMKLINRYAIYDKYIIVNILVRLILQYNANEIDYMKIREMVLQQSVVEL